MRIKNSTTMIIVVSFLALAASGCAGLRSITGDLVHLSSDDYVPRLGSTLEAYKGGTIYLGDFYNRAENTHQFSYPSHDKRLYYKVQHGSINSYFWYCFQVGLQSAGLKVVDYTADPSVPRLEMVLEYLTDARFEAEFKLFNRDRSYVRNLELDWSPPQTEDRQLLAVSAYRMMDQVLERLFSDPEFQKVFFYQG